MKNQEFLKLQAKHECDKLLKIRVVLQVLSDKIHVEEGAWDPPQCYRLNHSE